VTWFWGIWLFGGVAGTFAVAEGYALKTGRMTLSRFVWNLSKAFPLFPWLVGLLTGGLAVHFFWGGAVCFQ